MFQEVFGLVHLRFRDTSHKACALDDAFDVASEVTAMRYSHGSLYAC